MIKLNTIKKVSLPPEHGSWSFVLEPLILSLLVAFSSAGLFLAVTTFFIFLNHQPIRVLLNKKINKQLFLPALLFFVIYSVLIVVCFFSVYRNTQIIYLLPFAVAVFLMAVFFILELLQKGRKLLAEFIAPISITFIGISIVLIGGWKILPAAAFAVVLLARSIPTVLYIHLKVQHIKKKKLSKQLFYFLEFIFFVLIIVLVMFNLVPRLSIIASIILIGRAIYGLSEKGLRENIKTIGIREFIYGILYVVIVYIGYNFNL